MLEAWGYRGLGSSVVMELTSDSVSIGTHKLSVCFFSKYAAAGISIVILFPGIIGKILLL